MVFPSFFRSLSINFAEGDATLAQFKGGPPATRTPPMPFEDEGYGRLSFAAVRAFGIFAEQ